MSRTRTPTVTLVESLQRYIDDGARSPEPGESLEQYLTRLDLLGHGFAYRELVNGGRKHQMPPLRHWPNLALTLRLAIEFRLRAIQEAGVRGLKVAAAYRPRGGASRSAHKYAKALDLDRIGGSSTEYFRCAARFWAEYGEQLQVGLGLYTWGTRSLGGVRVHLDTGHGLRTWQGIRTRFGRPWNGHPLTRKLLADMGLRDPSRPA
ncbi:MAG: hypothetical protein ACRBN8_22530 [Nannocystales bacterium]